MKLVRMKESGDKAVVEVVRNWLQRQNGKAFCDDCIATKLGFASRDAVGHAATALSGEGYDRTWADCVGCRKHTFVSFLVLSS
jgi:hypothetical protein